jgi:hypothetical protein
LVGVAHHVPLEFWWPLPTRIRRTPNYLNWSVAGKEPATDSAFVQQLWAGTVAFGRFVR